MSKYTTPKEHTTFWQREIPVVKPEVPCNHAMIGPSSRSCDGCGARSILSKLTPVASHPIIKHACGDCVVKLKLKTKDQPARWKKQQSGERANPQADNNKSQGVDIQ